MRKVKEMISKAVFENILQDFASQWKLFSNERQFQLELAWALKEKGYTVFLEVLEDSEEKNYIDLIIKVTDTEYIAIELKYTTKQKRMNYNVNGRIVPMYAQGAGDVRRFDYLKDVQRIEKLLQKEDALGLTKAKIVSGYAIIMTNDSYSKKVGEDTGYREVTLYEGRVFSANETMRLHIKGYEDRVPVCLSNEYVCNWENYNLDGAEIIYTTSTGVEKVVPYTAYPFEYMIFEVK